MAVSSCAIIMCFHSFHHLVHTTLLLSSYAFDFPLYFALNQVVVHLLHVPIIIVVSFDRVDSDVEREKTSNSRI